eukprot:scaffold79094_cov36-Attheya_sp.AAC.1
MFHRVDGAEASDDDDASPSSGKYSRPSYSIEEDDWVEHARDTTAAAAAKEGSNKDDLGRHGSCGRKEEMWFPLANVPNDSCCCVNNKHEGTFVRRSPLLVTTPIEALAVVLNIIMVHSARISYYGRINFRLFLPHNRREHRAPSQELVSGYSTIQYRKAGPLERQRAQVWVIASDLGALLRAADLKIEANNPIGVIAFIQTQRRMPAAVKSVNYHSLLTVTV